MLFLFVVFSVYRIVSALNRLASRQPRGSTDLCRCVCCCLSRLMKTHVRTYATVPGPLSAPSPLFCHEGKHDFLSSLSLRSLLPLEAHVPGAIMRQKCFFYRRGANVEVQGNCGHRFQLLRGVPSAFSFSSISLYFLPGKESASTWDNFGDGRYNSPNPIGKKTLFPGKRDWDI